MFVPATVVCGEVLCCACKNICDSELVKAVDVEWIFFKAELAFLLRDITMALLLCAMKWNACPGAVLQGNSICCCDFVCVVSEPW